MGDSANIAIKQHPARGSSTRVYFYTHWDGFVLPLILQRALVRGKGRWNDEPYLARIIFSEMIKDSVLTDTGYGISTYRCDGDGYPVLVVDVRTQTVTLEDPDYGEQVGDPLTFNEYVALKLECVDPWTVAKAAAITKDSASAAK